MAITRKEYAMLLGIVNSEFQDGGNPVGKFMWSWSVTNNAGDEIKSKRSAGGIVASLVKKGLALQDDDDDDACIAITQAGYDALVAAGKVEPWSDK